MFVVITERLRRINVKLKTVLLPVIEVHGKLFLKDSKNLQFEKYKLRLEHNYPKKSPTIFNLYQIIRTLKIFYF